MSYDSVLPPNSTDAERAIEQVMGHMSDLPIDIRIVKNPDLCPVKLLPWLAWEYAITYWDNDWSETQKRGVIKNAAAVNKQRGTPGAVKKALSAVDRQIDLVEWFNDTPKADPYTFRVVVHGNSITEDELQRIASQIGDAKNARSFLTGILINEQVITGKIYIGGAVCVRQTVRIKAKAR